MPSRIYFFCEDVDFRPPPLKATTSWIDKVAKAENRVVGSLNYIFCSDTFLLSMNVQYLGHDTLTDTITFETGGSSEAIEGEVYISIERVKENAKEYKVSFTEELHRVMVHGLLHLFGYRDKTDRDKKIMRKKESTYLSLRAF